MLLRSPDRRWLSSEVQSDLVLVCSDGSVPAHSAFLAGSSPLLASLLAQPSSRLCGGCQAPRSLILAGVKVTECRALVELLYTGKTSCHTDLDTVKHLGLVLGLELEELALVPGIRRTVKTGTERSSYDGLDGVHHRFRQSNLNQAESMEDLKLVKPTTSGTNTNIATSSSKAKISVIPTGLKQLFQSSLSRKQHNAEDKKSSSASSFSTPLPPHSDPGQRETEGQGKVVVPNAVLSEVMQMMPVENIKVEVEDSGDTQDFPQMEGREEDEKDVSSAVSSYLSMNNSRNFVCDRCDSGFTFVRSFNWHRLRCKGTEKKTGNNLTAGTNNNQASTVCKYCNEKVVGIKKHLSLVHFKSQLLERFSLPPLKCKECGKCFKAVNSLVLHIGVVHGRVKTVCRAKPVRKPVASPVKEKERNSLYKASQLKKKLGGGPTVSTSVKKPVSREASQARQKPGGGAGGPGAGGPGGGGRKVPCGHCVKCLLADCGSCPPCSGGGDPGLSRVCVKKVCRNKVWVAD